MFLEIPVAHLLPPANEVAGRLCFYTCVILFTVGGVSQHAACITGHMSIHPPGGHSPEQTPPWADTSPDRHPLPRADTPQMVNERAVRILRECILVLKCYVTATYIRCIARREYFNKKVTHQDTCTLYFVTTHIEKVCCVSLFIDVRKF